MTEQTLRSRKRPASSLPDFIEPMHPRLGKPFRSDGYSYEVKWDGVRALAFVGKGGCRLVNRRRAEMTLLHPELACLARLPAGTVLDAEIIVLRDGLPDFASVLRRDLVQAPRRSRLLARELPATLLVFDVLYSGFRPVMHEPLETRRARAPVKQHVSHAGTVNRAIVGSSA